LKNSLIYYTKSYAFRLSYKPHSCLSLLNSCLNSISLVLIGNHHDSSTRSTLNQPYFDNLTYYMYDQYSLRCSVTINIISHISFVNKYLVTAHCFISSCFTQCIKRVKICNISQKATNNKYITESRKHVIKKQSVSTAILCSQHKQRLAENFSLN